MRFINVYNVARRVGGRGQGKRVAG